MAAKKTSKKTTKAAVAKSEERTQNGNESTQTGNVEAAKAGPTAEQQAEIDKAIKAIQDEAVAKAKAAADAILGGQHVAGVGTPQEREGRDMNAGQADFLPGDKRLGPDYVPSRVYDENTGAVKQIRDDNAYNYCMIPQEDFHKYNMRGWKFCMYDGGSRSGLLNGGFKGTGDTFFVRQLDGHCRRGDVFLMWIERRRYEEIVENDERNAAKAIEAPIGDFYNEAYAKGIRAMAEVDGQDIIGDKANIPVIDSRG